MPEVPEPLPVRLPQPAPAVGSWPYRTARAIVVERRLPTALSKAVGRFAVAAGVRHRTVVVPDAEAGPSPARLRVRRGTADPFFVEEIFVRRAYTPARFEIGPADVVFDVGGNIGSFAVFAGRRARRGKVVTVEPAGDSFALLSRNIAGNGLANVIAIRAAVAGTPGPVLFYRSEIGTGAHSLDAALAGTTDHAERVDGLTLADLFERGRVARCDLLKLDCEGAEFPILETASPDVLGRVRRIALEYHTRLDGPKRAQADGLVGLLIDAGFAIDRYEDHLDTNLGMVFARRP